MKKKLFIIIPALFLSATLLTSCNVEFGVKPRPKNSNTINLNSDKLFNNLGNDFVNNLNDIINNGSSYSNDNSAIYKEDISKTIPMDGIENVNISIDASNLTINAIDGSDFTITCTGSSSIVNKTTIENTGNTLNIKEHSVDSNINLKFLNGSNSREVVINIPKSFDKDINLSCGAGNVSITKINSKKLTIDGGAGNLTLKDISFSDLDLTQGLGNANINLSAKSGDMNINGGLGNLTINFAEVGGNLNYDGGMGETVISIPNNSPVKINTSTGVGSIDINAKTSGEDIYTFDLNIGVGSLTVN
ncbi:MAG: DUF4097 family beta strand repeat-containing protein [Clostridium sp.]